MCQSIKAPSNTLFQIRKSSSSVYANIREANYGQSKADMLSKFEIALKECSETEGWLQLLFNTNGIDEETYKNYRNPCGRIRRMLISSWKVLKTLKEVYKNARFTASVSRAFSSFTGESGDTEFTIAICMYLGSGKSGKSGIYHKPLRKKYMLRRAKHGNPCPNIPDFSSD